MQKKIALILILMSTCVLGIMGLQLYWNFQNYKTITQNFKKDANHALETAVNDEIAIRQQQLIIKVKHWLADTSFIRIESNINNRDSNTVFTVQDVHPRFVEDTARRTEFFQMGISKFHEKLKKITPAAKTTFINHFAEYTFKSDLEDGNISYYTQGLGDSISNAFNRSRLNIKNLNQLFKRELAAKEIFTPFQLNATINNNDFKTDEFNSSLRRPFEKQLIWASLENPNAYYLKEMKWLIISSFLLIGITLYCFYYTVKTLFNQQKLVALKNQFISNMTHEINTPLASIQVTAEALQQFNPEPETREKYLTIILYQTQKLNMLTKEILENAKLDTLGISLTENIILDQLIIDVITELNLKENVNFNSSLTPILIEGNKLHFTRAITNILENAMKYNAAAQPKIDINLNLQSKTINLTIADNGPGIADELKLKVFDQFYRIPTGNMHNIKGYGLGLSYVKKVIDQHKGSISVIDNEPSGSIFIIKLPA